MMSNVAETVCTPGKIVISIVAHHQGERIAERAREAGAGGGTILSGRGTAENSVLEMLGIGDTEKDIVFIITPEDKAGLILNVLQETCASEKKLRGIAFVIDVHNIIKASVPFGCERESSGKTGGAGVATHELISIIVNSGYADDAMAAARQAGASGGTIINARGTGKEEDVKFFGMTIVPEKEMLLILVEKGHSGEVLDAIKELTCLEEPGSGIAYCMDVHDFISLGKK